MEEQLIEQQISYLLLLYIHLPTLYFADLVEVKYNQQINDSVIL